MTIERMTAFDTIAQRILYGLRFMYSEFVPAASEIADEQAQEKLHGLMAQMIDRLYENPKLLGLAGDADEAFACELLKCNPALDKVYKSIFKAIYDFYKFLYISFFRGEANGDCLSISSAVLRECKASYKPPYKTLLKEIGIETEKGKTEIIFFAEEAMIQSLRLLAEKTPVHINNWTSCAVSNFACCSFAGDHTFPFTGDFDFLLARVDLAAGLNGLLLEIKDKCLESGYEKLIYWHFSASGIGFNIQFKNKVGGFAFGYNPYKYQQFSFGTLNSIGVKAMLEDFENLDPDLQKYFMDVCKTCNGCLGCTKGGRNKIFATNVKYDGKEYHLCNDNYGRHTWDTIDRDLAAVLFKYHAAQEKYGVNWKKK